MEFCNLTDKEYKLAIFKKFNDLWENSKKNQWNCEKTGLNYIFIKDIKIIFKKCRNSGPEKKSTYEMRNAIESICSRVQQMENRISKLEDRNFE